MQSLELSHAHPVLQKPRPDIDSQHVILPFDLKHQPAAFWEKSNNDLLQSLFPKTKAVSFDHFFLIFCLEELPPKPWPRIVAGVLTTDINDQGPLTSLSKRPAKSNIRLASRTEGGKCQGEFEEVFAITRGFFKKGEITIKRTLPAALQYLIMSRACWFNCTTLCHHQNSQYLHIKSLFLPSRNHMPAHRSTCSSKIYGSPMQVLENNPSILPPYQEFAENLQLRGMSFIGRVERFLCPTTILVAFMRREIGLTGTMTVDE